VTEANLPARHLYERNGFATLHRFEAMVRDTNAPEGSFRSELSSFRAR
jgi:ribosomal protein S18 acetylase RimI-like enzyme